MRSTAPTVAEYIEQSAPAQHEALGRLRDVITRHLPEGFEEVMSYGMIGYVVPHSIFPQGYHCNPTLPLPFINLAAQKNFIALYHMGLYADEKLMDWFTSEWAKTTNAKPDMGKSCIRFKKPEQIPFELIGKLCAKMSVKDWIDQYTNMLSKSRKITTAKK
ncbi:MAG: DUF1801 domain-containing protein [Flavisolibacter sp.]